MYYHLVHDGLLSHIAQGTSKMRDWGFNKIMA